MSTVHAFIQESTKFYGHYQVVVHRFHPDSLYQRCAKEVIDCHNIGTAVAIRDRLLNPEPVAPVAAAPVKTLEQQAGCVTGGLGYTPAVTWLLTGRVEQVHNWATARSLKRDNPPCTAITLDGSAGCSE